MGSGDRTWPLHPSCHHVLEFEVNAINIFRGEEDAKVYQPGDPVFQSGECGEHMYVVLKGRIDIKIGDQIVETVQPGGIFGELALIDDEERSADAVAQTEVELALVDKKRFTYLVQNHPFFALYVLKLLAERLRRYSK